MNYEKIIIELLSRIQAVEEKLGISPVTDGIEGLEPAIKAVRQKKLSTADIKKHITDFLEKEKQAGKVSAEIICGVLHKQLGLKNAVPMVCNAMKACMKTGDTVVFRSPSGYSATLKIRYNLAKNAAAPDIRQDARRTAVPETRPETKLEIKTEKELKPDALKEIAAEVRQDARERAAMPDVMPDIRKTEPKPFALDFFTVWQRILEYEWAIFYLPDGGEFAYIAGNDYLAIVRSNFRLPRADIEKAWAVYPFKNTVSLQHLRYPSYIYAILTDERIIGRR